MSTKQILVIDDDIDILEAVEIILKDAGYEVEATTDASKAICLPGSNKLPDLILLDILIAQDDGRKISTQLKSQPKTRHIPICLISALPHQDSILKESQADYFLAKPFDMQDLLHTVRALLKKKS